MSKPIKSLIALGLVAFVAACGNQAPEVEEFVVIDPVPVTEEPTFNSKYD
ncbi:MAG: hypothetical protein HLUCCA08_11640 [Rhodobacteraceae bacterium HLUCCA08]|nr:MAG: hypothetical protein HLUCCA08_11640 [Rhodobacteraceae bacterium HLUCCA08]